MASDDISGYVVSFFPPTTAPGLMSVSSILVSAMSRVAHIWKSEWQQAWKTTLSMLRNRGYAIDEIASIPAQEVMATLHEAQEFTTRCSDTFIFITMEQKVGIKAVRKLQAWLDEHALDRAIVVYKTSITPFAKQAIL